MLTDEGEAVAADIGDDAIFITHDVTSEEAWSEVVERTVADLGGLDVLVNNAGIVEFAPMTETSADSFRRTFEVNQLGVFLGMKAVVPAMAEGGGSIINISSVDGLFGTQMAVSYSGTKFAVRGMTKTAALELGPIGIRVNSVHPGIIDTPMLNTDEAQGALSHAAAAGAARAGGRPLRGRDPGRLPRLRRELVLHRVRVHRRRGLDRRPLHGPPRALNTKTQLVCLWCGPIALLIFMVGFWFVAGLVPPPSPADSAREVQDLYRDNTDQIRIGLVLSMIGGGLTAPFVAAISTQMKRVEGTYSPLTYAQLGTGMLGVLLFLFPLAVMQVAAFRPDRDPEMIQLAQDIAWIPFIGAYPAVWIQAIVVGICAFKDEKEIVFPRWAGYFSLWVALGFMGSSLLYFFKTGPFAWNGIFAFWLPLSVFGAWIIVFFVILRAAILRQAAEG